MALFRQTRSRGSSAGSKKGGAAPAAGKPRRSSGSGVRLRSALRFTAYLAGGIAVMAAVGYFVAAVWLFPSPLLPNERMTPRVVGMTQREATREVERAGFKVVLEQAHHAVATRGSVTWQDPPAGTALPRESEVRLTISQGPPVAIVPSVEGMDLELATRIIAAVGLHVTGVDTVILKTRASAIATGTEPQAGDSVPLGRGITVHLAR